MHSRIILVTILIALCVNCSTPQTYDVLIRNGKIIDGTGKPGFLGDVGIIGDSIAALGDLKNDYGLLEIDAQGLVIAPGFINMLSWANESLIEDGRSQSDIRQGVTLEVLGEGESMGPLNEMLKKDLIESQQHIKYEVPWTTLGEYLEFLEQKGISPNVASFVGNATLRLQTIGFEKRPPTHDELEQMKELLHLSMEEGAVGLSTALIYVPSGHAQTDEIIELAKVVAEYDGMYISHIRGEEGNLIEAVKELISISREANVRSEIYHFKASGNANWQLLADAIKLIEDAREKGLPITTDMYMYNASSTGLNVLLPQWAKDGGHEKIYV
jgi:N-acyl-D-amino-acid deacylase